MNYGGTTAGVVAAVQMQRMGDSVVVINQPTGTSRGPFVVSIAMDVVVRRFDVLETL